MDTTQRSYTPPLSAAGFFFCEKFISLIVGPVGSTKTTAAIMKIAYHASKMKACPDGIRRSRAIWVRNTREQLRDTSIPDFLKWFPEGIAGDYMKTEYKFVLRFGDVECEVLFRGLDDANDVKRLLSLQASFGVLDEFRELNPDVVNALQGRLGRYPDQIMNGAGCVTDDGRSNAHLWGATNPPDMDTWWEHYLTNPPTNCAVYFQPSGTSIEADWRSFLPPDYYENLAEGKTQDWIDVYIHAKFGKSLAGKPVFGSFDPDFHVSKTPLIPIKSVEKPLIIGMDFGLNPSISVNQLDFKGRLLTFHAETADGMGLVRFCQTRLRPLMAERFPGLPAIVVGDPAGVSRAQTDERTCFDILKNEGFRALPAKTNAITARIAAVETFFSRQIDGGPGRLIDGVNARVLVNAYRGGYRYKLKKSGDHETTPEKNGYSHPADADQYACLHAAGGIFAFAEEAPRRIIRPVRSGGWT